MCIRDSLQGVNIDEKSLRKYTNSKCFANLIGYTGQISTEEYDALSQKKQKEYDKTDTVGKAGIEKTMDTTLKGKKGTVKLYVNNVGKVLDTAVSYTHLLRQKFMKNWGTRLYQTERKAVMILSRQ